MARTSFGLLAALCLAGCAASLPPLPSYYQAAAEHPAYPRSRYITAVGISTQSADDADLRARANVGQQISAQVQTETSDFMSFNSRTGDTAQRVSSSATLHSEFDRADLVRIVDRQRQGETFYSYAALDRGVADREYAAAASAALASFEAAAASAVRARAANDSGAFSTAVAEARRLRPQLESTFILRRAIAGHAAAEEAGYVARRDQLLALVEQAKAQRVVGVVFKPAAGARLGELTVNAVKRLGLRPDSAGCEKRQNAADATVLEVEPEESCTEISLGERCEITVRLVAQGCAGGTSGAGTIAGVRGVHPSDRDKARRAAWDKINAAVVEAAVRDALKSALQIGE